MVNGLYPPAPAPGEARDNELVSLWRKRRLLNDRELARLRESWEGPRLELPQLPLGRGPELIATLQHCLENVEKGADAWG